MRRKIIIRRKCRGGAPAPWATAGHAGEEFAHGGPGLHNGRRWCQGRHESAQSSVVRARVEQVLIHRQRLLGKSLRQVQFRHRFRDEWGAGDRRRLRNFFCRHSDIVIELRRRRVLRLAHRLRARHVEIDRRRFVCCRLARVWLRFIGREGFRSQRVALWRQCQSIVEVERCKLLPLRAMARRIGISVRNTAASLQPRERFDPIRWRGERRNAAVEALVQFGRLRDGLLGWGERGGLEAERGRRVIVSPHSGFGRRFETVQGEAFEQIGARR